MNQEKPLTLLGAMPELGTLEKYLKDCYLKEVDIDTNIVSTFGEKVNDRIRELSKTYNLQVDQEECLFIDDLIEFVKREPELIKEPLEESKKNNTLDDAMMDIYTLLDLMGHCSNGSEAIHPDLGGIFLLLARAAKEKAEYFQEKYKWDFSIKAAPETETSKDDGQGQG